MRVRRPPIWTRRTTTTCRQHEKHFISPAGPAKPVAGAGARATLRHRDRRPRRRRPVRRRSSHGLSRRRLQSVGNGDFLAISTTRTGDAQISTHGVVTEVCRSPRQSLQSLRHLHCRWLDSGFAEALSVNVHQAAHPLLFRFGVRTCSSRSSGPSCGCGARRS